MTSPWQKIRTTPGSDLNWLWLPGWSFSADVFEAFYDELPGHHWAADYLNCAVSFETAAASLAATAPGTGDGVNLPAIWIGWSLGGALAATAFSALPDQRSKLLVTLATGQRFLSKETGTGMQIDDFETFSQLLIANSETTLKRFTGLCAQGSSEARSLIRQLKRAQHCASNELSRTLEWLSYDTIPASQNSLHIYGHGDALTPSQILPAEISPGESHAFFLTEVGVNHLVQVLRTKARLLDGGFTHREHPQ
jgi:pimeloyl-ACP methyl ester carboxylesterase